MPATTIEVRPAASEAFDYATTGLATDVLDHARAAAARIRRREGSIHTAIFEIGQDLLWAKETLGHGNFLRWIEAELAMSPSTARRYMDVAERLDAKFVTVTNLPPATLYALASPSTPDNLRSDALRRVQAGAPIGADELRRQIAAARQAATQARRKARKSPEEVKRDRDREARRMRDIKSDEERRQREYQSRKAAADDAVALLRAELGGRFALFQAAFAKTGAHEFAQALKQDT